MRTFNHLDCRQCNKSELVEVKSGSVVGLAAYTSSMAIGPSRYERWAFFTGLDGHVCPECMEKNERPAKTEEMPDWYLTLTGVLPDTADEGD